MLSIVSTSQRTDQIPGQSVVCPTSCGPIVKLEFGIANSAQSRLMRLGRIHFLFLIKLPPRPLAILFENGRDRLTFCVCTQSTVGSRTANTRNHNRHRSYRL